MGNINISGAEIVLSASDDAVHADNELNISGGNLVISESYEGLEGNVINISGIADIYSAGKAYSFGGFPIVRQKDIPHYFVHSSLTAQVRAVGTLFKDILPFMEDISTLLFLKKEK